jgi:hypothetical protein
LALVVLHKLLLEDLTVAILFSRLLLLRAVVVAVTILHLQRKQVGLVAALKATLLELALLATRQAQAPHKEATAAMAQELDLIQVAAVAVVQARPEEME